MLEEIASQEAIKYASIIDSVDRITGPLAYALMLNGNENYRTLGYVISALEIGLVKIPYAIKYVKASKDYTGLFLWTVKEVIANNSPIAGLLDILPTYKWRASRYIKKNKLKGKSN